MMNSFPLDGPTFIIDILDKYMWCMNAPLLTRLIHIITLKLTKYMTLFYHVT